MVLKFHAAPGLAKGPEGVDVTITWPVPIAELNPQLERRTGLAHELRLVDPEHVVESLDVWQRRLPDADSPNLIGFDERNVVVLRPELMPQPGSGHPPGRAAADNDNAQRV